jgi:tetratricopeptide (TPR) repeat protein
MKDPFELYLNARKRLTQMGTHLNKENYREVLVLLEQALDKSEKEQVELKAKIHRLAGEMHEKIGNMEIAISRYRIALYYNPKVGVKRKLENLQDRLSMH